MFTGCGATTSTSVTKTKQEVKKTSVRKDDQDATKVLVAYYSATGSTKAVAETIAEATDGDLFEFSLRDVELTYNSVEDWNSVYKTICAEVPAGARQCCFGCFLWNLCIS